MPLPIVTAILNMFPTRVGMNRRRFDNGGACEIMFPTRVGMNRCGGRDSRMWWHIMFPTRVGMNRTRAT